MALQFSKELFPTNDCVIIKTTHQANTEQHFIEFQKVQSDEKLQNFAGIDTNFQEKINQSDASNFVITFNRNTNSTHLMIPELKESTEIDKEFIEKNKGYLTEKSITEKDDMTKKNLESQFGELKLSDKKGAIIATADYNVSVENGKPIVHKIESFEFEKISREGLDIGVIRKDLVDGLSKNANDDLIFTQKKVDNSMEVGM